jgi:hypothetical protein
MGNYAQVDGLRVAKLLIFNGEKVEKSSKIGLTLPSNGTILYLVS